MARYFLDTHIVVWLITDDPQLDENLRYDIQYPRKGDKYITSEFVVLELIQLKQLGKIKYIGTPEDLFKSLVSFGVELELTTTQVFDALDNLPILTIEKKPHTDMMDRIIIAHSIAYRCTLISHDHKFPYYCKHGLDLLKA